MSKRTGLEVAIPYNETYFEPNCGRNITSIFDGFDITISSLEDYRDIKLNEVEFPFHYVDDAVEDFTDMKGFFQSEKYFCNAKSEVIQQLQFKQYVKDIIFDKLDSGYYPDPSKCTSLHIRLGDYTYKRNHHPSQPASYWQQAIKEAGLEKIIIFSDDVKMAKQMFGESSKLVYSTDSDPFVALYHMSLCKNNIICNSTFGWWGAWLGEQTTKHDKTVIAPSIWFGPGHSKFDTCDIIPDRWLKI
ncbi:alpha-1,2-fucosyltransferase [bacterium]|nr:alpha-1,2-fucosyltransferase [bacterium]